MYTKIICSQGFIYWLDLNQAVIEMVCMNTSQKDKKYSIAVRHPVFAIEGGEVDFIHLTKSMSMEDLKTKYESMLPVDVALDFTSK